MQNESGKRETHRPLPRYLTIIMAMVLGVSRELRGHKFAGPDIARHFFLPKVFRALIVAMQHDMTKLVKKREGDGQTRKIECGLILRMV